MSHSIRLTIATPAGTITAVVTHIEPKSERRQPHIFELHATTGGLLTYGNYKAQLRGDDKWCHGNFSFYRGVFGMVDSVIVGTFTVDVDRD